MYGSTDCIYLLAARGADVAHMDTDGNTPLELAEGSGRQSAVDALKKLQLRVKMQEKRKVGRGMVVMRFGVWCVLLWRVAASWFQPSYLLLHQSA
jgi:hypothetical protein